MMPFIFCAPWLMPIANTRNGTRIEYGSSSKPNAATSPSCHTTATSEHASTSTVERTQRVYSPMIAAAISAATAKYSATCISPAIRSPASLAKPITCTLAWPSASTRSRICSSDCDSARTSMRSPVRGSVSSSGTTSMLDLKSLPTRLPTMPARAMLPRSASVAALEPS